MHRDRHREGIPIRISVFLILFAIYLSGMFKVVEEEMESCMTTLYVDHCWWLVMVDLVEQVCSPVEKK